MSYYNYLIYKVKTLPCIRSILLEKISIHQPKTRSTKPKYISIYILAKSFKKKPKYITDILEQNGYIILSENEKIITKKGLKYGMSYQSRKNSSNNWIIMPEYFILNPIFYELKQTVEF